MNSDDFLRELIKIEKSIDRKYKYVLDQIRENRAMCVSDGDSKLKLGVSMTIAVVVFLFGYTIHSIDNIDNSMDILSDRLHKIARKTK